MNKPNPQQVARAGEHFVAAELHRRGAYAVTFAGNMPEIDILASDVAQTRTVAIQVKTKRAGDWQTTLREWTARTPGVADTRFWVFVDLHKQPDRPPEFFVVPERWIQENIDRTHATYLQRHGGHRAKTPRSKHHAIRKNRIEEWRDRWDLLGIFENAEPVPSDEMVGTSSGASARSRSHLGRRDLQAVGFQGFVSFRELVDGRINEVPNAPGVYVVLREDNERPRFLAANPGGRFKGKDPTVEPSVLEAEWVEGAHVIYIGLGSVLRRRLHQFARFGAGHAVGHWGGRYVWQLDGAMDFVVAWQETPHATPRDEELALLARFREFHDGRRPFANIAG